MVELDAVSRFLNIASLHPYAPAVVEEGQVFSYKELELLVRKFAFRFSKKNKPKVLIALPQGVDAYAVMLAAGLAGGFYVPVNVASPADKLGRIINQVEPDFVVCNAEMNSVLMTYFQSFVGIDASYPRNSVPQLFGYGDRHELAYVMFTSGSTGLPKGVMIPRTGLNHYVNWLGEELRISQGDRLSQHPNIAFDLSVFDIYGALCFGGSLYPLIDRVDKLMPARFIKRYSISIWNSVPSVMSLMIQANQVKAEFLESVRLFSFCGEPLLQQHVEPLFHACPQAIVQNTYGPTEATVSMTQIRLSSDDFSEACRSSVALGDPIKDMAIHLMGGHSDSEGEIVITGPQLSSGYWGDAKKTNEVFKEININGKAERSYYTGDWAERINGYLFFKDRIDFQVKVNGYRIELDEVLAAINNCGWPIASVIKYRDGLAALIEVGDRVPFDASKLRAALGEHIDQHAIPKIICSTEKIPRNENDKIDRRAVYSWLEAHETL